MALEFPAIFTSRTSNNKFYLPSKWLLKKFGVVCHNLRDRISVAPNNKFKKQIIKYFKKLGIDCSDCSNFVFHLIKISRQILNIQGADFKAWSTTILENLKTNSKDANNLNILMSFFNLPREKIIRMDELCK